MPQACATSDPVVLHNAGALLSCTGTVNIHLINKSTKKGDILVGTLPPLTRNRTHRQGLEGLQAPRAICAAGIRRDLAVPYAWRK